MIRAGGNLAVGGLALAMIVAVGVTALPVERRLAGGDDPRADGTVVTATAAPPLDLAPLKRFAPFGRAAGGGDAGDAGDAGTVGLEVRGILLARPATASIALIAAAGGPANGYGVGATLPGGAVVDAVEFDLVVLRADGRLVTLALPARSGGAAASGGTASGGAAVPAAAAATAAADPIAAHDAQLESRPPTLLGSLGAAAGPGGYRVGATLSDELRRAGLQPGDTIEQVDGVAVGNAERDRALFDKAVVAGRMRVAVVRAGKPVVVSIPLH